MKFNARKECNNIINFIRNYYNDNNLKGAIIGISGGKDSAVVAAIMCKAIGKENVIGVTMPCHSNAQDALDAQIISDFYGFKLINFDLSNVYDTFKLSFELEAKDSELINSDINLKPRFRMATLYYLSAFYSSRNNGTYIVCGTSNKCELYVGYFTKGGDNVSDISPISDLTVSEVIEIGEILNVPSKILYKVPSDGLSFKSDEEKLGVKYSSIEKYLVDKTLVNKKDRDTIEKLHNNSLHKFNIPSYKK